MLPSQTLCRPGNRPVPRATPSSSDGAAPVPGSFFGNLPALETAYTVLLAAYALLAVGISVAPAWCTQVGLGAVAASANAVIATNFMGVFGSCLATAATCMLVLKDAAAHNRLTSNTYKTLNLGLAIFAASLLGLQLTSSGVTNPALFTGYAVVCVPTLVVCLGSFLAWGGQLGSSLGNLLTGVFIPKNLTAGLYSTMSLPFLVFFPVAGLLPFHPLILQDLDPVGQYIKRKAGLGLFILFVVHAVLKDAADRGRLGASTFRALNLTTSFASIIGGYYFWQFQVQGAATHPILLPALLVQAAFTVLFCDYQYFFAKK